MSETDDQTKQRKTDPSFENDDANVSKESEKVRNSQPNDFLLGSQDGDCTLFTDRVPLSLVPKLSGYSVSNPAVYTRYSSQPSSIGDFYYDDEYDQDHLGLVISRILLDHLETEVVIKDMLDNVFLSMSLGGSCPTSLESCDSVVEISNDRDVTLVSDDDGV